MRAHSFRSVFGTTFLMRQTLYPARLGLVAAALAVPAAALVGAGPKRSQQVGLHPPDPRNARAERNRQPLFERAPAGKAALADVHGIPPSFFIPPRDSGEGRTIRSSRSERRMVGGARAATILLRRQQSFISEAPSTTLRVVPLPRFAGADARFRSRDAPSHPSFASRFKKALPTTSPHKEGRRSADKRLTGVRPAAATKACLRMRRAPSPRSTRTARDLRSGTLAFRRSTAIMRRGLTRLGSGPRFLEPPDPNGSTLSGTSAASTSQSGHAPDGTMSRTARMRVTSPPPGTAPAPSIRCHRSTSLR
jgi:hypothetical protein